MTRSIDRDNQRFKEIVRGKVRQGLKKYITHGEVIGRKGRETVSIPVPSIDIPHFRHGQKGSGGVDREREIPVSQLARVKMIRMVRVKRVINPVSTFVKPN